MLNQNFQEPFVAIVIDPVRTISAGKVCLGAFRTYPKVCIFVKEIDSTIWLIIINQKSENQFEEELIIKTDIIDMEIKNN